MIEHHETRSKIVLLCATRRGLRFLERLVAIAPTSKIVVLSFPEEEGEPPYFDEIRSLAAVHSADFVETRQVGAQRLRDLWEDPPHLLLAVSWRYMVPANVYNTAKNGAFVFHDSLLPRYRGFAPTVWAMLNGENHTGVTLFEMTDSVDAGAIVAQRRVPIGAEDTIAEVLDRVTDAYLELLQDNLPSLLTGTAPRRDQDHSVATYTCKRIASDGLIDWSAPTRTIHNLVRAVTRPYWGAFTTVDGRTLRIWECRLLEESVSYVGRVPGRVVELRPGIGTVVLTGDGALLVTKVQLDGDIVCAADALKSLSLTLGR